MYADRSITRVKQTALGMFMLVFTIKFNRLTEKKNFFFYIANLKPINYQNARIFSSFGKNQWNFDLKLFRANK